tara:strand:- start:7517 stop:8611 length:1095 start_codon:yes stop_codon:yes gene_type:complete
MNILNQTKLNKDLLESFADLKAKAASVKKRNKRALHLYAVTGKRNSGDFFLGPSTKWRFQNIAEQEIDWEDKCVRDDDFNLDFIKNLNTHFDYLVIGGGGLFLPDTNANDVSRWQWSIESELIKKINIPIYVVSVGWNLFHGQKIGGDEEGYKIFKENIETLVDKSEYFTLRHNGDLEHLKKVLAEDLHDKIRAEFCPTINFCLEYVKNKLKTKPDREYYAFEVKIDREHMRYRNISKEDFYNDLKNFALTLIESGKKVCVLSHDGNLDLIDYFKSNGVKVEFFDNSVMEVEAIINNYLKIKKLFCTAGHSQMMGYSLGCDVVSLITHDKLKYFLEDINNYKDETYVNVNEENVYEKLIKYNDT